MLSDFVVATVRLLREPDESAYRERPHFEVKTRVLPIFNAYS